MKFRRILAAMLSALMLTSVMSFSAFVNAADGDIIKAGFLSQWYAERGKQSIKMYDEENDIIFTRLIPNDIEANAAKSCYINISGQAIMPTAEQIADDTVYAVFYVRTNMTLENDDTPSLMNYQSYWGTAEKNVKVDGSNTMVKGNENFDEMVGNDWSKICFKLDTTKEVTIDGEKVVAPIYKWDQLAFLAVGTAASNPIKDWAAKAPAGEEPNMECAGYAVFTSLEAAENYDFIAAAKAPKVEITFDKGLADDDSDVEAATYVSGYYINDTIDFPEVEAPDEGYEFIGWFEDAEYTKAVDAENVKVPETNKNYYALWQNNNVPVEFSLESLTINGSDASKFGVEDINADELVITLPYGWEKLEEYGVMPEVVPTATSPAIATYVAPATLDDAGKIEFAQGTSKGEVAVKFVIADAPETKIAGTGKISAGVYSTTGVITLPDGSEINTDNKIRAVGLKTDKEITHYGITANKFTPIYKGSELDGTMVSSTEYYTSNRSTNLEGYNAFGTFDFESYNAYRALVYYDTGADGEFDIEVNPRLYFQSSGTTGTMNTDAVGRTDSFVPASALKGDRWEYIYFTKSEKNKVLYGKAVQPVFSFFAKDAATKASNYKDDTFYFAQVEMLAECPEVVSYKPTSINAVAVDGDTPGCINGVTDDMELLVDGEWVAVTELDNYANGTIDGLTAGEYSVRYAADDVYGASEATVLEVLPGAVFVTFDAQNDTEATVYELEINTALTAPAAPAKDGYVFKGWATEKDGEAVTLPAIATETITYYAVWEKIEVVYVKSSAETSGDGYSADAPVKTLEEAAAFAYNFGGTIVVMDDVAWPSKINGTSNYNHVNEDIVITSVDPVTGTDYPGALVQTSSLNFAGDLSKKITIRDIEIASWRFGSASDKWQYINFRGHPIEFDNVTVRKGEVPVGYAVGQDAVVDGDAKEIFFPVHMRAQGEQSCKGYGHQIVMGDVEFTSIVLGGKVAYEESTGWYKSDIDLVFTGNSNTTLGVANDTSYSTVEGVRYFHYGRFNNVKLLFETSPKSIYMSNISGIDGTYRVIANNGAVVTIPSFTYVRSDDKTTNADGSPYTADLTPKGGFWQINSAEGGRVDFTEEDNVFAVTTDATYIVVTNKANGTSRKIRVADGVEGDANLFDEDGVYLLTLEAGEYDIAYTDEAVKVTVVFENGDNDETYEVAKGEKAVFAGEVEAPAGKVLAGWQTEDGEIVTTNNEYTADTYSEEDIVLYPVFADDSNAPYYYIYGEYDKINAKYTVDVKIANGKFTAGTFGLEYNTLAIELADDGIVMGEGVQNYLGNDPEITKVEPGEKSGLAMIVWNAASGIVDASENEVTLATFTFDVIDTDNFDVFFGGDVDGWFNVSSYDYNNWEFDEVYEKYYNGEYYLVSPENTSDNPYAVDYVPSYFGEIVDKEKSYEKASITFNVTFDSKEGATDANVGELIVYNDDTDDIVYTIDAQGNEEATVTQVVEDFYVGDTVEFYVHKNGYMAVDVFGDDAITAEDGLVINITLLAGDIKGNTEDCCGDGEITLADFVRVVRAFDETARDEYRALVDINEDGAVTVADLAIIKANFNKTSDDNAVEYGE